MSSDLYSVNTELMEMQRLIGSYQLQITNKRREINHLENALTELERTKGDFGERGGECSKPVFTTKTFHGGQAKDVTSLKKEQLRPSFAMIPDEQITRAAEEMREQIRLLQGEIGNLENSISSCESRKQTLNDRKEELKKQDE